MPIRQIKLPSGETVPAVGQGAFRMGEDPARRADDIRALQLGIDLGMSLIDTAELYGDGASEQVVGEAIAGRRDKVFITTKILPTRASRAGLFLSCEKSLKRLGTDHIDLYLLHWRSDRPLAESVAGLEALKAAGKIRHWGVSNFEAADLEELLAAGGAGLAANQLPHNLNRRGIELGVADWLAARGIPVMAYTPVARGAFADHPVLIDLARAHATTPTQIALAFVLNRPATIAIPKASSETHLRENFAAADIDLTVADLAALDSAFPLPAEITPFARNYIRPDAS